MGTYIERSGGVTVTLRSYDSGMKRMLTDEMFAPALMAHANASKGRAELAAKAYPTRYWGKHGSQRRVTKPEGSGMGKHYEDAFETDIGYGVTADGTARIRARLVNTNPFAHFIEYGNGNITARRFVRKATGIYRFDAQGDKWPTTRSRR